jgi:hypothetical protein
MGGRQQEVPNTSPSSSREGEAGEGESFQVVVTNRKLISQPRTEEQKASSNKRVKANESKRRQKIKDAGIDYEFEGHQE